MSCSMQLARATDASAGFMNAASRQCRPNLPCMCAALRLQWASLIRCDHETVKVFVLRGRRVITANSDFGAGFYFYGVPMQLFAHCCSTIR